MLVIVDKLTKMIHYKQVKIIIDTPDLAEVIINVVIWHRGLPNSIITNQSSLFISKFWFLLCYFLEIKKKLSTAFHPQTNSQTKRQNSTIEEYLRAFVNWKQNNWAHLLPIAEFAYNNAKNASISHTSFELNFGYHPHVFFKDNVNPYFRSRSANKFAKELRELMDICQ